MAYTLAQLNGADNAATALDAPLGLAIGVTSLVVDDPAPFPTPPFAVALGSGTVRYEEVVVTAVAGSTWTLQDPTTRIHVDEESVENTIGAVVLDRLADFATLHTHTGGNDGSAVPTTFDATAPTTSAVGDAAAAGSATVPAHRDHLHGREAFAAPAASAVGDAGTTGTATTLPHSDHKHAREGFGSPAASAVGDTAADGSAATVAHSDHRHAREAFAAPTIALGTAAAAGAATTPIRSDATILAFDATAPSTQAFADAAAVGVATVASRRDHKHAMPKLMGTSVYQSAASLSLGTAAYTTIAWNSENTDDPGWHDTVTNNSRITTDRSGKYCAWLAYFVGVPVAGQTIQPELHKVIGGVDTRIASAIEKSTMGGVNTLSVGPFAMSSGDYVYCKVYNTDPTNAGTFYCQGDASLGLEYLGP